MIDFTTIQTFDVLPELSALNAENIALKKSNRTLNFILGSLAVGIVGGGIYYLYKKRQDDV